MNEEDSSSYNTGEIEDRRNLVIAFFQDLIAYTAFRLRQLTLFCWAFFYSVADRFSELKTWSVQRMYWGRGSLYRSFFHIVVFSLTLISLLVGISQRVNVNRDSSGEGLVLASGVLGNYDTIYQAGTTEAIAPVNPSEKAWNEFQHIVKSGETLDSIAGEYGVNTATIKWANNLSSDKLRPEQVLTIPELDGVLYEVKQGDTVASVIQKIDNANEFDIKELNKLQPPNYDLSAGQKIFIPNGIVKPPKVVASRRISASYIQFADPGMQVAPGTFINPLNFCGGYKISRGVLPWHTGVDMAKAGGCWVNASGAGVVKVAEWSGYGQGFFVEIDHGNGFISYYYHGNGDFAVKKGDSVKAGQRIMYMGCTGNCTGTHVHFEVRYNGAVVNPMKYVSL